MSADEPPVPDVLYLLKANNANPPLRYSLRSLQNLPHERVFVSGWRPEWLKNVEYVPVMDHGSRWENSTANLLAACLRSDLSETFILMNDDFYITRKVYPLRTYHRGTINNLLKEWEPIRHNVYAKGMFAVGKLLRERLPGVPLYAYNLHVPMVMEKSKVVEALLKYEEVRNPLVKAMHTRTWYGNYWQVGGERIKDVKVIERNGNPGTRTPFLSTSPDAFRGEAGRYLKAKFPRKSRYELP